MVNVGMVNVNAMMWKKYAWIYVDLYIIYICI